MAKDIQELRYLYKQEFAEITHNPNKWQILLHSSGNNFRCDFDSQILINAQKNNTTAILTHEAWEKIYHRGVDKSCTQINLPDLNTKSGIKTYCDITETYPLTNKKAVIIPLWSVKAEHHTDIIDSLKNAFKVTEEAADLGNVVNAAIENILDANMETYFTTLTKNLKNSSLGIEDLTDMKNIYRQTIKNSVQEMVFNRCNVKGEINTFEFFNSFDTTATIRCLGAATQNIGQTILNNISKTSLHLQSTEETENMLKEVMNNEAHLHGSRRSVLLDRTSNSTGEIRSAERTISERGKEPDVSDHETELESGISLGTSPGGSSGTIGNLDDADAKSRGSNRSDESPRPNEMGGDDEQHQESSRGNSDGGVRLQLNNQEKEGDINLPLLPYYDRNHEDKSLPSFNWNLVNEVLRSTPYLKADKPEITEFFKAHRDREDCVNYIKSIFNKEYSEIIINDKGRVGYKTYQNVLHLWEGSYLSRTSQAYYNWGVIAGHIEGMILLNEFELNTQEAAEKASSAFNFSPEIIDAILIKMSQGKFNIYEHFLKEENSQSNAKFLKEEYGWGGVQPIIAG
ncbi:MAG: hypothetical protein RSC99_08860, partial [Clostridiales bacterium]